MKRLQLALMVSALFASFVSAQPPKAPMWPPINPAQARPDQVIGGLDGPGFAIVFSDETGILAAACEHGTIQFWTKDVTMGVRVGEGTSHVLRGHQGAVVALAWRGAVLASAGADQKVILWSMPDGQALHTLSAGNCRALAMSPDGKLLACGSDTGLVQLWDVATGQPGAKLEGHTDWILSLAFSPDGKQLASGGYDGTVRLWDVTAAKKIRDIPATPPPAPNTPPPPTNVVTALAFSPDGKQLAVGGSDALIQLLNPADGKLIRPIPGHGSSVTGLIFHPTGTLLVSSSKDRTVRLWNPANGQAIKSLEGHTAWVQGVTFLTQATRLASVGADHTVRFWDLTEPPKK